MVKDIGFSFLKQEFNSPRDYFAHMLKRFKGADCNSVIRWFESNYVLIITPVAQSAEAFDLGSKG